MADYLLSEARWARTQQAEVRAERECLEDPATLANKIEGLGYALDAARLKVKTAKAALKALTDPALLEAQIEEFRRNEAHWQQLAEGYEQRLIARDQPSLLDDEDEAAS